MYFNRKLLIPTIAVLSLPVINAGDCSQTTVKAISDAGFLKYVLLNCISGTGGAPATTNILGKSVVDAQACLATFKSLNNVSFGSGACESDYLTFVSGLAAKVAANVSPFDPATTITRGDLCSYDASTDTVSMSYLCWNLLSNFLTGFQQSAGYPIFMEPCDGATVRDASLADTLQQTVTAALTAAAGTVGDRNLLKWVDYSVAANKATLDGTNHIVVGKWVKNSASNYKNTGVDLELGMCYGAYQTILDYLQGATLSFSTTKLGIVQPGATMIWKDLNNNELTTLEAACKADITSNVCSGSILMGGIRELFQSMSGYDILFTGPLCDAASIAKVENPSLRPTPYQFFVMCGLMASQYPAECSSSAISQYVSSLESSVGSECNGCYLELSSKIQAFISNTTATAVCNSLANITSDACVAAMAPIASDFKDCSGADLYTKIPSSIPTPTPSDQTNTTTNGTASSDAVTSRMMMSSGVIVLVSVLAYLM